MQGHDEGDCRGNDNRVAAHKEEPYHRGNYHRRDYHRLPRTIAEARLHSGRIRINPR